MNLDRLARFGLEPRPVPDPARRWDGADQAHPGTAPARHTWQAANRADDRAGREWVNYEHRALRLAEYLVKVHLDARAFDAELRKLHALGLVTARSFAAAGARFQHLDRDWSRRQRLDFWVHEQVYAVRGLWAEARLAVRDWHAEARDVSPLADVGVALVVAVAVAVLAVLAGDPLH